MTIRRRLGAVAGAAVLAAGLTAGAGIVLPGEADAAACTTTLITSCTITGSVGLTGGLMLLLPPVALLWSGNVTGQAQSLVDSIDTGLAVSDLRGTGLGWNVTASATTFTNGSATLPDTGTLSIDGTTAAGEAATVPSSSCLIILSCTVPTAGAGNEPTFPLLLTTATAPTPVTVYEAQVGSGQGLVGVGTGTIGSYSSTGTNPFAWWVNVPAGAIAGAYTSTVTMAVASGP